MSKILLLTIFSFIAFHVQCQTFSDASSSIAGNLSAGFGELGSPVSFADFNMDGLDDLTFGSASGLPLRFYLNTGSGFVPVVLQMPPLSCDSKHVLWVDFDNDGDRDLFVTCNMQPNRLFRNNGTLNFTDITPTSGIAMESDPTWGATFGDYNKDGLLDLYLVNLVQGGAVTTHCNHLYQNSGNGTFTDETWNTNSSDSLKAPFCAAFFDYNKDGWPDLYLAQDRYIYENTMLRNEGNGTFFDAGAVTNTDIAIGAMNVGVGDYDNDADLDIYVTNEDNSPFNVLYTNDGNGAFTNDAASAGVKNYRLSWGANFADFNNDSWLDIYVSNQNVLEPNGLYMNNGNSTFDSLTIPGDVRYNFTNAIGDFNNDGFPDIANSGFNNDPNRLWQNTSTSGFNWIKVNLQGTVSNREGIGSWIEIYVNGNKYVRYTHCGIAYLAQNTFTENIGIGQSNTIDSVKVIWLSGIVDKLTNLAANQTLTIIENSTNTQLPVELIDFEAVPDKKFIQLRWSTASEVNFEGFDLERSEDALSFSGIHREQGLGSSGEGHVYTFNDYAVLPGQRFYYRLKMFEDDGQVRYSSIISSKLLLLQDNPFAILQNPVASSSSELRILSALELNATIELHDLGGKLIFAYADFPLLPGSNSINLPRVLPSGIYLITIKSQNHPSCTYKLAVF